MNSDEAVTIRASANAFFLMDSADRNTTQAGENPTPDGLNILSQAQPWNNFRISKNQPLLDAFARRIGVTEVNFPWAIPNVTPLNNVLYIFNASTLETFKVEIAPDFYTGTELAAALQTAIAGQIGAGNMTVTYDVARRRFTFAVTNGLPILGYDIFFYPGPNIVRPSLKEYFSQASLCRTLGLQLRNIGVTIAPGSSIVGGVTMVQYTAWLDIVSTRIHYDTEGKDGNTSPIQTRDVLCRIFCADEISNYAADAPGTRPFIIHRQYFTPKMLKLNPEQFLASVDFQVLDEYGNLCYAPSGGPFDSDVYPDFQLTFISSEN